MSARRLGQRSGCELTGAGATGFFFAVAILGAVLTASGCSDGGKPGTARLAGRITIDGQPPPAAAVGSISFRATGQGQADSTSAQIVDGKYECDDVPLGDVVVFVQLVLDTGKMASEGGRSFPERRNLVSSKHDVGINLKVTDDNSNQNFELTGNANSE